MTPTRPWPVHTVRMTAHRLGRPPAGDSAATRQRILVGAREAFSELGYGATTNKQVAVAAGITTGALYHYFGSKLDLYVAVHEDVQQIVYARFTSAIEPADTFGGKIDALFDAAHDLNASDPTLARFLGSVRIDRRRYPEIAEAFRPFRERIDRFYDDIVDLGVQTGEIDLADRERVLAMLQTVLTGLTDAVSHDIRLHRLAVEGLKMLIGGKLVRPPA
jgi:AcrR family transcriptional regulator